MGNICSSKLLSKDNSSTGLSDALNFSYFVHELKPRNFRILSSGIKPVDSSCLEIQ